MSAPKNITGIRSGRLTVLELYGHRGKERIWKCQCDCGGQAYVRTASLVSGYTKSCGCLKKESIASVRKGKRNGYDIVGEKFGRLLVLKREDNGNYRQSRWLCLCDCGQLKIVNGQPLRSGKIVSCGCYKRENASRVATKHGLTGTRKHRAWVERRSRDRSKLFDSSWEYETEKQLLTFFNSCVLCGGKENLTIDHLLPLSLGYGLFSDNAVVLCGSCNSTKHNTYITELPARVRKKLIKASCDF